MSGSIKTEKSQRELSSWRRVDAEVGVSPLLPSSSFLPSPPLPSLPFPFLSFLCFLSWKISCLVSFCIKLSFSSDFSFCKEPAVLDWGITSKATHSTCFRKHVSVLSTFATNSEKHDNLKVKGQASKPCHPQCVRGKDGCQGWGEPGAIWPGEGCMCGRFSKACHVCF